MSDDLYREVILDHHRHPRCTSPLEHANAHSSGMNPACGDEVSVNLDIQEGAVKAIQVEGKGCAISTAAGSMFADRVKGMTTRELKALAAEVRSMLTSGKPPDPDDLGDLEALLGVSRFPVRVKCAMLPIATALEAVASFEGDNRETS
jgi:nitrogen fixation protein NifU and related proteins